MRQPFNGSIIDQCSPQVLDIQYFENYNYYLLFIVIAIVIVTMECNDIS